MSFFGFIIFLIVVFIVIPFLRMLWAGFKLRNKMKKAFREFQEQMQQQQQQAQERQNTPPGSQGNAPQQKKKFDRNQGEYVEWEEIKTTASTADNSANTHEKEVRIEKEPQISDAEWEEIR